MLPMISGLEDVGGAEVESPAVENAKDSIGGIQVGRGNGDQVAAGDDELHQPQELRLGERAEAILKHQRIGPDAALCVGSACS